MVHFADFDKNKTKILKLSKKALNWRKVDLRLNLFGKCINKKCSVFGKEVICIIENNIEFDFDTQKREIVCPICFKNFIPLSLGFLKCEYQIKGKKLENVEYRKINIKGRETKDGNFEYYDPYDNGTSFWSNLIIFACPRQKMKYKN